MFFLVALQVGFAVRSAGSVLVAMGTPRIDFDAPWEVVPTLPFASSGARKTADWLALVQLPVSKFAVITGVGDLS